MSWVILRQGFNLVIVRLTSSCACHRTEIIWRRTRQYSNELLVYSLGITQHKLGDFTSALQSHQHALDIRVKLFGEKHSVTAQSYYSLGVTQHELGDFTSALHSKSRALDIRVKLFLEEHSHTAESYYLLGHQS